MNLDEFREVCNKYISSNHVITGSTQLKDLQDLFLDAKEKGWTEGMTEGHAQLVAKTYFTTYIKACDLGKKAVSDMH